MSVKNGNLQGAGPSNGPRSGDKAGQAPLGPKARTDVGGLTRSLQQLRQRVDAGELEPGRRKPLRRDSRRALLFAGVAAALHFGLPNTDSDGTVIDVIAEQLTSGMDYHRLRPSVQPAVQTATAFFTDFSEQDPLKHWQFIDGGGLILDRYEKRMSALARGASLARPTQAMRDGRMYIDYIQQHRQAGFIVRGQADGVKPAARNLADCYRLALTPVSRSGRPELIFTANRRRRGVEQMIHRQSVTDLHLAGLSRQLISVQMEDAQFTARLHWVEPSRFPGWPASRREVIIASWKDSTFRDGSVGLWGGSPAERESGYRVLTVATEV